MLLFKDVTPEEREAFKTSKLEFVRLVKNRTGCGLKEAKEFSDDFSDEIQMIINGESYNLELEVMIEDELSMLYEGYKLDCVKALKERLHTDSFGGPMHKQFGLKEAKEVADHYQNLLKVFGFDYVKDYRLEVKTREIYNNIPKGLKILKLFNFKNVNHVLVSIKDSEIFLEENKFDLFLQEELSDGLAIYTNRFSNFWELELSISVYKKVLNEFIKKLK